MSSLRVRVDDDARALFIVRIDDDAGRCRYSVRNRFCAQSMDRVRGNLVHVSHRKLRSFKLNAYSSQVIEKNNCCRSDRVYLG